MKIGLIGCGKVGTTLFYLLKKNNRIVGVYDTNKRHEKNALRLLHINKNLPLRELCMGSDVLFIATTDGQILPAYKRIKPFLHTKKYIYHFSGLLPAEIFPKTKNILRCSIHPFATFPKIVIPPRKHYILFTQGDREAQQVAKRIFSKEHFTLHNISKSKKPLYHLLGVFSSNLIVGLVSAIDELARRMDWKEDDMSAVVLPLIEETLYNIRNYKIKNALSGPLERGDVKIVRQHLKMLTGNKTLQNTYKVLSLNILKNILKAKKKKEIEKLLKE
ncbi:hypothetical protein AMJ52_01410 [candidate division TA06 bacterium DG_78]|uniref:DUF2520 domain-containing protein n=1 Tax=candidate division TA06 bacterium DG_78 TaxID=1703772 RepID=A0A0S7YJ13_UNCT6|nr:MAG: hypothetical protein AMJ52_01410 [candidate division TA06 bacterium DG_78]